MYINTNHNPNAIKYRFNLLTQFIGSNKI